jgi:biopolymer transport protein ExbD
MKKTFLIVLLLINSICFAQKETIELPRGEEEIEFSSNYITALFDVYLEKNGTLYIKDSIVSYKQLGDLAFKFRLEHPVHEYNVLALLHIDKDTPYKYVDSVKIQLRQSYMKFFYRTGNMNNAAQGIWNFRNLPTFFKRELLKQNSQEIRLKPYEYADFLNPELYESYLANLYARRFRKADSVLNKMKYKKITYLENDSLLVNNVKVAHIDVQKIYNEINETDICFIKYNPKLLYKHYLKNIIAIKELWSYRKKNNLKKVFILPISGSLQKVFDKQKIKL